MENPTPQNPLNFSNVLKLILTAIAATIGIIIIILLYYPISPQYDTTDDFFNVSEPISVDRFKDVPRPSANHSSWDNARSDETVNDSTNKSIYDIMNATWLYENGYYGRSSGRSQPNYPAHPVPELKPYLYLVIGIGFIIYRRRYYE
jgi:hypothetical protein